SLGRLVKTEFPDQTFSRVKFDSWMQASFDQNDTVEESEWHRLRVDNLINAQLIATGKDPVKEKAAAQKAAAHYNTPTVVHLDTLGRPILSIDHNRVANIDEFYQTRVVLDVEGNARSIVDARGNTVIFYKYNMLGHRVYQKSMDAGERWMLNNVAGNPIRGWDGRDHIFSYTYDELQRPVHSRVEGGDGAAALDNVFARIIYGEGQANDRQLNLRGKPFAHYDTAGKQEFTEYDFKGNLRRGTRRLATDYKNTPHWSGALDAQLDGADYTFSSENRFDALNRVVWSQTPDGSITEPEFNEANLLETVRVTQNAAPELFVKDIDYNEKGQRRRIVYGNDVATSYSYDPETFRLVRLETRKADNQLLQDLRYTYDPVGNITHLEDRAIPTVFFGNQIVEPAAAYTYDALYRLIEATGREHIGQITFDQQDNWDDRPFLKRYGAGDAMAWRNYTQNYRYDQTGNILEMNHSAGTGSWTRDYVYESGNNRLNTTEVGGQTYTYPHHPQHGFMTAMPHLQVMNWNFEDELQAVAEQQRIDGGTPETTYYVYDSGGERVRKVTENAGNPGVVPTRKSERLYIGAVEVYREHSGVNAGLERKSLHVMDDTRRIAMIETRNAVNDGTPIRLVRYQLSNHLGSATLELDNQAQIISYEEYHPYGTTSYQATANQTQTPKRYRFTGMERDEESGFNYHSARYYLPWLGRWTACDPISIDGGINVYVYVSNPLAFVDPSGEWPEWVDKKIESAKGSLSSVAASAHAVVDRSIWSKIPTDRGVILEKFAGNNLGRYMKDADRATATVVQQIKTTSSTSRVAQIARDATRDAARFIQNNLAHANKAAQARIIMPTGTSKAILDQARSALQNLAKPIPGVTLPPKVTAGLPGIGGGLLKALGPIGAVLSAASLEESIKEEDYGAVLRDSAGVLAGSLETIALGSSLLGGGSAVAGGGATVAGGGGLAAGATAAAPYVAAFAVGATIGVGLEKTLDVSDYSSSAGMAVNEGLKEIGANETFSLVVGGGVTILATPVAVPIAAVDKTYDYVTDKIGYELCVPFYNCD
ncbi:MAG: RHS repeat-associated core domain-containing protein, partial [Saprospiraceae bacterium]|nr:RHS repeat-associated core domain-containing protein [Pyrinomonadaceae bacterium]